MIDLIIFPCLPVKKGGKGKQKGGRAIRLHIIQPVFFRRVNIVVIPAAHCTVYENILCVRLPKKLRIIPPDLHMYRIRYVTCPVHCRKVKILCVCPQLYRNLLLRERFRCIRRISLCHFGCRILVYQVKITLKPRFKDVFCDIGGTHKLSCPQMIGFRLKEIFCPSVLHRLKCHRYTPAVLDLL